MSSDTALYLATVGGVVTLLVFTVCGGIRWLSRIIGRALEPVFRPLAFLKPVATWIFNAVICAFGVGSILAGIIFIAVQSEGAIEKVPAKYHDWQRQQWVEECAKYSELPDCNRRYSELQVGK
jgi:hypothetical protein